MAKMFYEWEDANDPNAGGHPNLGVYAHCRLKTKAAVRKDWKSYLSEFPDLPWEPKIRVWRIAYEEVKL